jgi:hypothetical protein
MTALSCSGTPALLASDYPFRTFRLVSAFVLLISAAVLVLPLGLRNVVMPDKPLVDLVVFYGATTGAYGLLPFVRRGDIATVAMWVVLGAGVAPCLTGQELSPQHMFGAMGGVLMAVAPIYIARFRQIAQGDTRPYHRRGGEADL